MQERIILPRYRSARRDVERQIVTLNHMKDAAAATGLLLSISEPLIVVGDNEQISATVSVARMIGVNRGKTDKTYTAVCFADDVFIRTPGWMFHLRQTLRDVTIAEALRLAFPMGLGKYRLADELPIAPLPLKVSAVFRSSRHIAA